MNTPTAPAPHSPRLHPLLATAAIAVTTVSLAGIAVMSGWLPMSEAAAPLPAVSAVSPAPTIAETTPVSPPKVVENIVIVEKPVYRSAPKVAKVSTPPAVPPLETTPSPPSPVLATGPLTAAPAALPAPTCFNCGTIDNVREVMQEGEGSGLGAVVGGVLGGVLGNQVGGGSGNKIATVLGAAGGAYAGHQVEKTRKQTTNYEISVRMEDGSFRTVSQDSVPAWRIGDRVKLDNGRLITAN
ncbi:MAG: glycine zipper 2TM domain-containing protein [Rhodocyclaceae bacterium]|nr:glycine zipper 2TM domain-containing protein [Rhodocyclaceae bacterium]MDZ4213426.1 glycine zipper 2TM domain-containing protein [Rhodocyclaceae bacterium]